MVQIQLYSRLTGSQIDALSSYLDALKEEISPYQTLAFLRLWDEFFRYRNLSLVAYRNDGTPCGFLPQWRRGRFIESVPWRDKGGPIFDSQPTLDALRARTMELAGQTRAAGVLWKDFKDPVFTQSSYFINVDIDLAAFHVDAYWKALPSAVRGKIRQATRSGLKFSISSNLDEQAIRRFYSLFVRNRRRLGVPVYRMALFQGFAKYFASQNLKLCEVVAETGELLAALFLLHNKTRAIDAYSAASEKGLRERANDFLLFNVLSFCIEQGISKFDFGADSPFQETLIAYKIKWLGRARHVTSSVFGTVKQVDASLPAYNILRALLRALPDLPYRLCSTMLVR